MTSFLQSRGNVIADFVNFNWFLIIFLLFFSNAAGVITCIEDKTADCPARLKVQLRSTVDAYMRVTLENQCSIMPDSIVALPDDGYSICQQVLQHGDYGKCGYIPFKWAV